MGMITRAADLAYTFRFLRLLTTPFEDTKAFKLGIIDGKGKRIRSKRITSQEKSSYTSFHRLVYNIKRLIPGGKIGSYASALYLVKEHANLSDQSIAKIVAESEVDPTDILAESTAWYILDSGALAQGVYKLRNDKMVNENLELLAFKHDKIRVAEECLPTGDICGLAIFKAQHLKTGKSVYVTASEIIR